jgi:tetratricopeptide (TPR) repeat protein/NAD-dependent SIR2 family protein deacetylase
MGQIRRVSVRELALKIKPFPIGNEKVVHPRFAVFLGAGASIQSGVKMVNHMIDDFKERIFESECPDLQTQIDREKWLEAQVWYQAEGSAYCKLFDKFEPKERGRQLYIESLIEGKAPSFGYAVLANLMSQNLINTIITTNFDDLVYSACTSFTGIRPIVYAYGVLASEMRLTAQRPKVLKLHGDYLWSRLKNTKPELKSQDQNMARQFIQILSEYGLIVIGYNGSDKSVMRILEGWLPETNDLYWCHYKGGSEPADSVIKLLESKGGFLVEIEGFDEMMNEIREVVGFDIKAMLGSIEQHQIDILELFKRFNPEYSEDILQEVLQEEEREPKAKRGAVTNSVSYFLEGLKAHKANDFVTAEEKYRKAIEIDPLYAWAYLNLGDVISKDEKRLQEAEKLTLKAIELDPYEFMAYNNLGSILSKDEKRLGEAEEAFHKAIELNPSDARTHCNLGIVLSKDDKRRQEAEEAYRKAIAFDPFYMQAYLNFSFLIEKDIKRRSEAEALLQKAIILNPNDATMYLNLGTLLSKNEKRLNAAEALFRKTIDLDSNIATAFYNLGIVLLKNNIRRPEAEEAFRKAIELDPTKDKAYYDLGTLIGENEERNAEAEEIYRKAIEIGASNSMIYNNLGALLSKDGKRLNEAKDSFCKAIELDSNNALAYLNLGIVLSKHKSRLDEAEKAFRKAIELNPQDTRAYFRLGFLIENEEKRWSEAINLYRHIIELDSNDLHAYGHLFSILRMQGKIQEALSITERGLEIDPQNVSILVSLAALHKKLGNKRKSTHYAAKARKLIKPDSWYNLACLESICGNINAAIEALEKASGKRNLNPRWAELDPDLEWIRNDPRFAKIIKKAKKLS